MQERDYFCLEFLFKNFKSLMLEGISVCCNSVMQKSGMQKRKVKRETLVRKGF
jgi:hypothetical protein